MMTIKDLIELLTEIQSEEGNIEVVATAETGETYTPAIGWGPDKDGVRRVFLTA